MTDMIDLVEPTATSPAYGPSKSTMFFRADVRHAFAPRPAETSWAQTRLTRAEIILKLSGEPLGERTMETAHCHRRGAERMLDWLSSFAGDNWHQRWTSSGIERTTEGWEAGPLSWLAMGGRAEKINQLYVRAGVESLICTGVVRPGYPWLLGRRWSMMLSKARGALDRDGFATLERTADKLSVLGDTRRIALGRAAHIMVSKGGLLSDITVGDVIELAEAQHRYTTTPTHGLSTLYRMLQAHGNFPPNAPPSFRAMQIGGKASVENLVDRYAIAYRPMRDLIVDYLRERQPAIDHVTLRNVAATLAKHFWRDLELHQPGITSLHLDADVAAAWKDRLRQVLHPKTGAVIRERGNYRGLLLTVRAFYLDLARWAAEEPTRWAVAVAPCPIRDAEVDHRKIKLETKSRIDQRTRDRLPELPHLVARLDEYRQALAATLAAARQTDPGQQFQVAGRVFTRSSKPHAKAATRLYVIDDAGQQCELVWKEDAAFWAWAIVEVLRHTGIRLEELLELTHHSFVQYRLPTTGEIVPLLQIVPSKIDTERLILVSPELGDVLASIIKRIRGPHPAVPLVSAYDGFERTWHPPMPFLFQRANDREPRGIARQTVIKLLGEVVTASGFNSSTGRQLRFTPHDFRRMFVTDAILQGLPPHIAQIICGHQDLNTTMGYKAVYPHEAIAAHRAFIARRRAQRPSEEYRDLTAGEWDEFLGHFEQRKLSLGLCTRAFGTPCHHEHACVRCPALRPDPAQADRLQEIRDNLTDRIAEAEREGWRGELDGLRTTLAATDQKLAIMQRLAQPGPTMLGMPNPASPPPDDQPKP